jgi:hypothetical protein
MHRHRQPIHHRFSTGRSFQSVSTLREQPIRMRERSQAASLLVSGIVSRPSISPLLTFHLLLNPAHFILPSSLLFYRTCCAAGTTTLTRSLRPTTADMDSKKEHRTISLCSLTSARSERLGGRRRDEQTKSNVWTVDLIDWMYFEHDHEIG